MLCDDLKSELKTCHKCSCLRDLSEINSPGQEVRTAAYLRIITGVIGDGEQILGGYI